MTSRKATSEMNREMSTVDRTIRIGLGGAVLFGALSASMHGAEAYSFTKLFAAIVVLTGIAGWDPFYAMIKNVASRMTNIEISTFSVGNIGMKNRALRIGLGLSVLMLSLQGPIGGMEAYPFIKIFAALVVLTGIAGWDPLSAMFRNTVSYLKNMKPRGYMTYMQSH